MAKDKKEPNPRRGRAKKVGEGPATHVPGGAAGPDAFDPGPIVEAMNVYWLKGSGEQYVMKGKDGSWAVWNQQATIDKMLKVAHGMGVFVNPKRYEGQPISQVREVLMHIRENRALDVVFTALPGYKSDEYTLQNQERVLVKSSPRFVVPVPGEWPIIRQIIEGMFGTEPQLRQKDYYYSWLKVGAESVMYGEPGNWRPGHGLILAGPRGCGKGFLQEHVVTPLLGGRMADPQKMLFSKDEFNADCFAAEHLFLAEVPMPSQKMNDRTAFSEMIKQVVANPLQRMRLMRVEPWTVMPFWRLTISVNDHPDKLRNLPLITEDLGDKVIILHCAKQPMPMPTATIEQRREFRERVVAEIPHFLHWLLHEWEIPEDLLRYEGGEDATRFGFREFHHPIIKQGLFDDTPDAQALALIDMAEFSSSDWGRPKKLWELPEGTPMNESRQDGVWHQSAETLQQLLTGEAGCTCSVATMAKKLFAHNSCSRMLGRLAKDDAVGEGGAMRVVKTGADTRLWKGWLISRPPRT